MIQTLLLDIDGILTDGKITIDSQGNESKKISFADIDAIFAAKRAGIKIGFITAENTPFLQYVEKRFEPDFFVKGCQDKLGAFKQMEKEGLANKDSTAFAGDSKKDAELLAYLNISFAPSNSPKDVKQAAKQVLKAARGQDVVAEVWRHLTQEQNKQPTQQQATEIDNSYWTTRIDEHLGIIAALKEPAILKTVSQMAETIASTFRQGHKLLICGNGGSATDAQHIAGEFVSRFFLERKGLPALALTANVASITAIGNDYSYERIFARQVEAFGQKGDTLLGISTSGNSKNVVIALSEAKQKGITTIGFTGENQDCDMAKVCDICLHVPSKSVPRVQEGHLLIGHSLCEYVEEKLFR